MSKSPERIWADPPSTFDGMDIWHEDPCDVATEYVRADLYAAQAADIARLTAERDAALAGAKTLTDVGLKFHSACTSAWACGEPEHKVIAMLDAAEEFCVVLVAFETDIRALTPPADLAAKIGGEA